MRVAGSQHKLDPMSTGEEKFEAELARTVGPTNAEALIEFFKRAPGNWLIHSGEFHPVIEAEAVDWFDGGMSWAVYTKADEE